MALRRGPITLPKSGFGFSEARPILGRVLAILLSQLVELCSLMARSGSFRQHCAIQTISTALNWKTK